MAKRFHNARLPRSMVVIVLIVILTGSAGIGLSFMALHKLDTREVFVSQGVYQAYETKWITRGKGADEVWIIQLDDTTYYLDPHTNRVLDRAALRALQPGSPVSFHYTHDKGLLGVDSTRQLLSLCADNQIILALEDYLKQARSNQYWGVGIGIVLILLAGSYILLYKYSMRHLYSPSQHRKRNTQVFRRHQ